MTLASKDKLDYEAAELVAPGTAPESQPKVRLVWGVLRLMMGFTFLWAFLDKLLALGFATGRNPETGAIDFFGDAAWINGASPTEGFLSFGLHTKEPFLSFYEGLAGSAWVDWIYMVSMAAIGIALILGIATRLSAIGGALWMLIFYTAAAVWPENNLFLDDHLVYAVIFAGLAYAGAGRYLGLGSWWRKTELVKKYPILQ
ncbi:MAG TPA: DoxX family protein [Actinomycetota bacterium]|nr:DoxX family protein [Actinomycetota bacterium]